MFMPEIAAFVQRAREISGLTNLYNSRPTWLQNVHAKLDAAVATAYGFPPDISDDDALAHLLALNHTRAK